MKKIKIKIKDYDKKEFELLENGEIGDFISLNDLNEINFSDLDNIYNEKLALKRKQDIEKEKINWQNEYKSSDEYLNSQTKIAQLEKDNENIKSNINTQVELIKKGLEKDFLVDKNKLNEDKVRFEKEQLQTIEQMKSKIALKDLEYKTLIENQKNLENRLKQELENKLKIQEFEITKNLESQFIDKENKLKSKIDLLERAKNVTSKLIGEDLEKFINGEYNKYFSIIEDSRLEKSNEIIDGTKPDFIFKTFDLKDNSILSSITIEAKSQGIQGNSSKKNEDFYEKLNRDRNKNKCEYALLVSELEIDNDFSILKINNFENMYVIRPYFFITFISLVRSIGQKRKDINTQIENFKDKQDIMDEFEREKKSIIDTTIKNIEKQLEDIHKKADGIIKSAQSIIDSEKIIAETHMQTITNKITNFSIIKDKNIKKIDFINKSEQAFREKNPKLLDEKIKIQ